MAVEVQGLMIINHFFVSNSDNQIWLYLYLILYFVYMYSEYVQSQGFCLEDAHLEDQVITPEDLFIPLFENTVL